jgi:hypothetical protein
MPRFLFHENISKLKSSNKTIEILYQSDFSSWNNSNLKNNSLASVRLRTAIAADVAEELNWNIILNNSYTSVYTDLLLVGKVNNNIQENWLERIKIIKASGGKVIIDYTDHHLDSNSPLCSFYQKAILYSDLFICSSKTLQQHVAHLNSVKTVLIDDPIEEPILSPKFKNNKITTFLWFGHASNLVYLIECLLHNFKLNIDAKLIIMTNAYPLPEHYYQVLNTLQFKNLDIAVVPWSKKDMIKAAQICDFCILPTGYKDKRKSGASSNRLLTALALGLPVLSDKLDSYLPFDKYYSQISESEIRKRIINPNINIENIIEAQRLIVDNYSIKIIKRKWETLLKEFKI